MPPHDEFEEMMSTGVAAPVPGLDITITAVAGEHRNVQVRTMIVAGGPETEANAVVDQMMRLVDRQKARYDLEVLEEQFDTVGKQLGNLLDGLPHAEMNHTAAQADRKERLKNLEALGRDIYQEGYDEHHRTGRRGEYKAIGKRGQMIEANIKAVDALKAEIERAEADKDQHRQSLVKSITHYRDDLIDRRGKINALRALAGIAPIDRYLDIQAVASATE